MKRIHDSGDSRGNREYSELSAVSSLHLVE